MSTQSVSITITLAHPVTTYGGSDGSITTLIEGGIPPYFYQWTRNGVNFSTEKDLINIPVGEYSLKAWSTDPDITNYAETGIVTVLQTQPPQSSGMYIIIGSDGQRTIVDCTTDGTNVTISH